MVSTGASTGSFETFFDAEYTRLARALFLVTGDRADAQDIAQEAMARVYERWARVSGMASPVGYLYRVGLNLNRKRVRRSRVRGRSDAAGRARAVDPASAAEARVDIRRALSLLPKGQREAIVLVEWMGMGAEEAGQVLGIRPGSVRARVSRAKASIREWYGGNDA